MLAVCRVLAERGDTVHIVSAAPPAVFSRDAGADAAKRISVRRAALDCGAVQLDAITVDRVGSLQRYKETAVDGREAIVAAEAAWLRAAMADCVLVDCVPVACAAAARARVPCVCVTNFSWDFIYADFMVAAGKESRHIVWQIAEDYASCAMLLRLPGFTPMPAFRQVIDVPLVVRRARRARADVRAELGIREGERLLLFNFGGQDASWQLLEEFLPPGWKCVVCTMLPLNGESQLPPRFFRPSSEDAYIPDILNACDAMLGKIGYGTTSEALAHGIPMVFVRRDFFNEEPFLRKLLEVNGASVEMPRRDFFAGRWAPYLEAALRLRVQYKGALNGAEMVADAVEAVAAGNTEAPLIASAPPERATRVRLRDTIVFGYQLQRAHQRTFDVPEWYGDLYRKAARRWPADSGGEQTHAAPSSLADAEPTMDAHFSVLDGDAMLHADSDVSSFLSLLARLSEPQAEISPRSLPEWRAAGALFDWDSPITVSRAPGRLDVMGGIADYSGSLVLQMPIAQACVVALQRQPVGKQRLWQHTRHRHNELRRNCSDASGDAGAAAISAHGVASIRLVSTGADAGNRAPTFDMDLRDLFDASGEVLSYERARAYFEQDTSRRWAAYVVGAVVVLMREKGVRFEDGMAILVHSEVPEGKGVSSSASVEVAAMSALAGAHGLELDRKELAVLCQKVENLVVGAPCGLMDQMASACGMDGSLMRMLCQPDLLQPELHVPSHVALWGIDSGIRHSVGGSDYGSVRVGAFMGKALINARRAEVERSSADAEGDMHGGAKAALKPIRHLAELRVHDFEKVYEGRLPETMSGEDFLRVCPDGHGDSVTTIDRATTYAVRAPTAHPVREHFRVRAFAQVLCAEDSDEQLEVLGELMFQSHESYGACGLGSTGTDRLVELVREEAESGGGALHGAKITGGGSGGTVCVLGRAGVAGEAALSRIVERYASETGHKPYVFSGSSEGAAAFGTLKVLRKKESSDGGGKRLLLSAGPA